MAAWSSRRRISVLHRTTFLAMRVRDEAHILSWKRIMEATQVKGDRSSPAYGCSWLITLRGQRLAVSTSLGLSRLSQRPCARVSGNLALQSLPKIVSAIL